MKRCAPSSIDDTAQTLDKGLWQLNVCDPTECFNGEIFTPVSPWVSGTSKLRTPGIFSVLLGTFPEEDLHFKIAGVLMRQGLKASLRFFNTSFMNGSYDAKYISLTFLVSQLGFVATKTMVAKEEGLSETEVDDWISKARDGKQLSF
jgi:hypothetical protein